MSFYNKAEVMRWDSETLADYLKSMRLSDCDKVVKRVGMNGSWFLAMSNSDLQKFPKAHRPQIRNICYEINQSEKRNMAIHRTNPSSHSRQDCGYARECTEFEDDDPEYSETNIDDFEDTYVCALEEEFYGEMDGDDDYEPPPSAAPEIPNHFQISKPLGDGDYIDSVRSGSANDRMPKPPERPESTNSYPAMSSAEVFPANPARQDFSSQRSLKSKSVVTGPRVDRSKKPRSVLHSKQNPNKPAFVKEEHYPLPTRNHSQAASQLPGFPIQNMTPDQQMRTFSDPAQQHFMIPGFQKDMDSQWYVGPMTRGEAEHHLRQINMDGAFLIRDSSKNSTEQPYTLMVLKEHKVYNIQIRFHGNTDGYSLGTGLMSTEKYCSVTDMVTHYKRTPLLLIDALDRTSGAQQQCCLLHPAMC